MPSNNPVLRYLGLPLVAPQPWGTHFCQFYQTKEDLIGVLVPYFQAGLENNEFCMWVTSEPLDVDEARRSLENSVPNLSEFEKKGQIEIIRHTDWYLKDGIFDTNRILKGWLEKLDDALKKGFAGLRLTGNTFWLEKKDWKAFTEYEEAVNSAMGGHQILALCTYGIDKCSPNDIVNVINHHQSVLLNRQGNWELLASSQQNVITSELEKGLWETAEELKSAKDLAKQNSDFAAHLQQLTINRELTMLDLKQKIQELQAKTLAAA